MARRAEEEEGTNGGLVDGRAQPEISRERQPISANLYVLDCGCAKLSEDRPKQVPRQSRDSEVPRGRPDNRQGIHPLLRNTKSCQSRRDGRKHRHGRNLCHPSTFTSFSAQSAYGAKAPGTCHSTETPRRGGRDYATNLPYTTLGAELADLRLAHLGRQPVRSRVRRFGAFAARSRASQCRKASSPTRRAREQPPRFRRRGVEWRSCWRRSFHSGCR